MYRVITTYDSKRAKNFYHSYKETDDSSWGNLSCQVLPAHQDINKARACYLTEDNTWMYDAEKYNEIVAAIEEEKKAAQEEADRLSRIPNNEGLYEMVLALMDATNEIATYMDTVVEPLSRLAEIITGGD